MIPRGMSIQEAYRLFRDGNLLVNRKYQRKLVWMESEKVELIDTILLGYPIPLFLLAERAEIHGKGKYEILDGVQRLSAVFGFIENGFPIDNKYFDVNEFARAKQAAEQNIFKIIDVKESRLDAKQCADILDYQLAVTIFPASNDEQVTKIFGRINSTGRRLSEQERRQAGVINPFGELVRKISAEIRGDASKEILLLSEMPEISIESSKATQKYGLTAEEIFWVRQGILWGSQLRNSEDEEMIADIVVSILLNEPFARSKEALDDLYSTTSSTYQRVESALLTYSKERMYNEITQVFSVIRETIEDFDNGPNALRAVVSPGRNPIKSSFYAIFMAFYDLMVRQNKSPIDSKKIIESLKDLQSFMITSAHYTKSDDRRKNIDKTIGLIQRYFVYKEPALLKHGPGLAMDFENSLRRSRIETPRYEFKQGLLELSERPKINMDLLTKIINTVCGIANLGPKSEGFIYIGVADKLQDAERIKMIYGTDYITVSDHYVVGVDREAKKLNLNIEKYIKIIVDHLRSSELSETLKTQTLTQIDVVTYKNNTVIRLRVPSQKTVSFVGDSAYTREGNSTIKIEGKKLLAVHELFTK